MASTRSIIAPPVFAADATTTIPPTPVAGVSYRDPIAGPASSPDGWPFAERVNSAEFNQIMFQLSTLVETIDKQGILGWTNLQEYAVPSVVFGSNGLPYIALQASGPTTAPQDPISAPTFWEQFSLHGQVQFTTAGVSSWTVPMAMQLGYVRPKVTVIGGGGGGGRFENGGGGGGGGGIASSVVNLTGVPSVSVTVAPGGAGRTGSAGDGVSGSASSFGAFVVAAGGGGASTWSAGVGGAGTTGDYKSSLGPGSATVRHDNPATAAKYGGGSGGGPGATGAAAAAQGVTGGTATLPGGGGGGGNENGNGGNGAPGAVTIEW